MFALHQRLICLTALALLGACGGQQVPRRELAAKPSFRGPPDFYFDKTFPDIMEFQQGQQHQYNLAISAHVPAPGNALLTVAGAPSSATFDGQVLSWTPACGDDPSFYQRGIGEQYIVVTLKSSEDQEQMVQRQAVMLVHEVKDSGDQKCGAL